MTLNDRRPELTTAGTGHARLHPVHEGHLFAGVVQTRPIRLRGPVTVIGSDPAAQVAMVGLAPRHAQITLDDRDEYVLTPLGGQVTVNGAPAVRVTLHTGDLVRCGEYRFSFARDESADHGIPPRLIGIDHARGLLARWERLLLRVTGPRHQTRRHRHRKALARGRHHHL